MAWGPWTTCDEDSASIQDAQTSSTPAIATHRGTIWCLWCDFSGDLYYTKGKNEVFQPRIRFPDRGTPVMVELLGVLHAVIVGDSGELKHFIFDDGNEEWSAMLPIPSATECSKRSNPALVEFENKLYLVFIENETLWYLTWTLDSRDVGVWSSIQEVGRNYRVSGMPTMFVLRGTLHILCSSNDRSRGRLGLSFCVTYDEWLLWDDTSEDRAVVGASATSYGDSAFLAFMENDGSHMIYVTEFKGGKWRPRESIGGQASSDPPQLVILNGRINCIFSTNDERKGLKWVSKGLLDYSLSSWMGDLPDEKLMSDITVPGTHDSCAVTNLPYIRTQFLSITEQMEAGIRFLDLRLRVHNDGDLYLYHGDIPINLPWYLKFDKVMSDVFEFMEKDGDPTEAVIVSINNTDNSGKCPPSVFYDAVQNHIDRTPRYSNGQARWITERKTVTLGEARGKAILLRRYGPDPSLKLSAHIGIDLSRWLNNNPDFTIRTPDGVVVTLQDKWQFTEIIPFADLIDTKFGYVSNLLQKAAAGASREWFLNFTSAVGDPRQNGEVAECQMVALGAYSNINGKFVPGMNIVTRENFQWERGKRYGILIMDFAELPKGSDLISQLIGTNF